MPGNAAVVMYLSLTINHCYGKRVTVFAVTIAADDSIKYQSFVYDSFLWENHKWYNKKQICNSCNIISIIGQNLDILFKTVIKSVVELTSILMVNWLRFRRRKSGLQNVCW